MRGEWKKLLNRTVQAVVVATGGSYPERRVFLVFDDGTHFEFYGSQFRGTEGAFRGDDADAGGLDYVVEYASRPGAKVEVIQ